MRGIPTRSVGTIKSVGARLAREAGDVVYLMHREAGDVVYLMHREAGEVVYLMHRVVDFAGKPRSNRDRLTDRSHALDFAGKPRSYGLRPESTRARLMYVSAQG